MGLNDRQVDKLLDLLNISSVSSLNSYYNEDDKLELLDLIASDSKRNYKEYVQDELRDDIQVEILLNKSVYDMSYKDIANELNMPLKEVIHLYDDGVRKLKNSDIAEAVRSS